MLHGAITTTRIADKIACKQVACGHSGHRSPRIEYQGQKTPNLSMLMAKVSTLHVAVSFYSIQMLRTEA